MTIDRSYLPYPCLRQYQDRGMAKWLGFFLSEHTSALNQTQANLDPTTKIDQTDCLIRLSQAYAHQFPVRLSLYNPQHKSLQQVIAKIIQISPHGISLDGSQAPSLVQLDHIFNLSLTEVTDNDPT